MAIVRHRTFAPSDSGSGGHRSSSRLSIESAQKPGILPSKLFTKTNTKKALVYAVKAKIVQPVPKGEVDVTWGWKTIVELVILLNAIQLGICVQPEIGDWTYGCEASEQFFTAVYTIEVFIKVCLFGSVYFRFAWNCLDMILVIAAVLDSWVLYPLDQVFGLPAFLRRAGTFLKFVRVLRIAKVLRARQELTVVLEGLLDALRSITWVSIVLLLLIYTFAIICVTCFSEVKSESKLNFKTIPQAMFTVFTLAIVGDWAEIIMPVVEEYWWAQFFFVAFVFVATFGILNLIIGVIADRTAAVQREYHAQEVLAQQKETFLKIEEIADLIFGTEHDSESEEATITRDRMQEALEHAEHGPKMVDLIQDVDLPIGYSILEFHGIFDRDASGSITKAEFTEGMDRLIFSNEFQRSCMVQGAIADVLFEIKASEERTLLNIRQELNHLRQDLGVHGADPDHDQVGSPTESDASRAFLLGKNACAESRAFLMRQSRSSIGDDHDEGSMQRSPMATRLSGGGRSHSSSDASQGSGMGGRPVSYNMMGSSTAKDLRSSSSLPSTPPAKVEASGFGPPIGPSKSTQQMAEQASGFGPPIGPSKSTQQMTEEADHLAKYVRTEGRRGELPQREPTSPLAAGPLDVRVSVGARAAAAACSGSQEDSEQTRPSVPWIGWLLPQEATSNACQVSGLPAPEIYARTSAQGLHQPAARSGQTDCNVSANAEALCNGHSREQLLHSSRSDASLGMDSILEQVRARVPGCRGIDVLEEQKLEEKAPAPQPIGQLHYQHRPRLANVAAQRERSRGSGRSRFS